MLKKVMQFLPKFAIILYYNAFIKSSFSYATMFWLNNSRSGRYKLITKVDKLISYIQNKYKFLIENFCNINTVFKRQSLIFMYDLVKNNFTIPYFSVTSNSEIHDHFTRSCHNIHIAKQSSSDLRNFIHHCTNFLKNCTIDVKLLHRSQFVIYCKHFHCASL